MVSNSTGGGSTASMIFMIELYSLVSLTNSARMGVSHDQFMNVIHLPNKVKSLSN